MKIGLAAGHGGIDFSTGWFDPGCVNGVHQEYTVALDIVKEIEKLIKGKINYVIPKADYDTAKMTQEAYKSGCDYYICIHINSNVNTAGNGVSVFWYNQNSEEFTIRLYSNLRNIFNQFSEGIYNKDMVLGQKYRNENGYIEHNLKYAFLECGFLSNTSDLNKLLNHKKEIAIEIVKALETLSGVKVLNTEIILNMQGDKRDIAVKNGIEIKMPLHLVVVKDRNMIDLRSIIDLLRPEATIEWNANLKQITIKY